MNRFANLTSMYALILFGLITVGSATGLHAVAVFSAAETPWPDRVIRTTNFRAEPSRTAPVIARLQRGRLVIPTGGGSDCSRATGCEWLQVNVRGDVGWVLAKNVEPALPVHGTATTTDRLNLRAGPSTVDEIRLTMPEGARVRLTGRQFHGFVSVEYDGLAGWVFGDYLAFDSPLPPTS